LSCAALKPEAIAAKRGRLSGGAHAGRAVNPDAAESVPTLLEAEQELLVKALAAADGNKTIAAKLLGVSRPRLYKMMERHGVQD